MLRENVEKLKSGNRRRRRRRTYYPSKEHKRQGGGGCPDSEICRLYDHEYVVNKKLFKAYNF